MNWKPISELPVERIEVLLTAKYPNGNNWSDVYHCWRSVGPLGQSVYMRWPHRFPPTHFIKIEYPA